VIALGIDAGTRSWKSCLRVEGEVRERSEHESASGVIESLRERVREYPDLVAVLPSGFGVPFRRVQDVDEWDLFEMTLKRGESETLGLEAFLREAREMEFEGYCIPSVKLLPSVPIHRKLNRVDMGTSDKLCSVVALLFLLQEAGHDLPSIDLISLEIGYAHKALLVVKKGRIVDGIGGTLGSMGPKARGAIDGELAYLFRFGKREIYSGGYLDLEEAFGGYGEAAFVEGLQKELMGLQGFYDIRDVWVYGRRAEAFQGVLGKASPFPRGEPGYEAAMGASLLAEGLKERRGAAGAILNRLGILEARERVLDWIYPAPPGV
jgi:predicted butyrate kinase (DUF1464 family)